MAHLSKKNACPPESEAGTERKEGRECGVPMPTMLAPADPNLPLAIPFKQFLKVTGLGRSTSFEMRNPKSPRYDALMPQGFTLFDSPNATRYFFYHEVVAWLEHRAEKCRADRLPKKGELLA